MAITIDVANTSSVKGGLLADRNLDVVLLTNNLTDITMRMANEQQLALDGLLSQHGEVYIKVTSSTSSTAPPHQQLHHRRRHRRPAVRR